MSSQTAKLDFEPVIWARLIAGQGPTVPAEAAKFILSVAFGGQDRKRMAHLATKSASGEISSDEQAEFDSYLHVGNLLAVMQSRARVSVGADPTSSRHS